MITQTITVLIFILLTVILALDLRQHYRIKKADGILKRLEIEYRELEKRVTRLEELKQLK